MSIKLVSYDVAIEFLEPVLGSTPGSKEVYQDYLQDKAVEAGLDVADEIESVDEMLAKGTTGFHRDEAGRPVLYNYVVLGFLKAAASALGRDKEGKETSKAPRAFRKVIDGNLQVKPRRILLEPPQGQGAEMENGRVKLPTLERPLRCSTAQGDRVALACSELMPAGTTCRFRLTVIGGDSVLAEEVVRDWFSYGQFRGLGQWRSADFGSFMATVTRVKE